MNNISAYNTICRNKKVSELFLGTIEVDWKFLKVNYVATCTEAVPLTFLEKMICGIIDIDGKTDVNNLAKVMGLNVEDDAKNLKFQDKAETEILFETLRTLKQFGVISTPDDDFTCIELTDLGKEYFAQGRKFKQGEQKGFTMYFDLIASEHSKAKTLFQKISVDGCIEQIPETTIQYSDENFVKSYAESQIPQYYSHETGNSFTNMSVKSQECLYKKVILGVIIDTFTGKYRLEVVDDGGINKDYITTHVNAEDNIISYINLYFSSLGHVTGSKTESQLDFEERIMQVQRDAEYALFDKRPQDAIKLVEDYSLSPLYMEKENLYNYINVRIKSGTIQYVYIHIPTLTEEDRNEILSISKNDNLQIMLSCSDLEDFDTSFGENVLVLKENYSSTPILIIDNTSYRCENLIFSNGNTNFVVDFLHRQENDESIEKIRELFANKYIPYELGQFENVLQNEGEKNIVDRIRELNTTENLIIFDDSYIISTGNYEKLTNLRNLRDNLLLELVQKYSGSLMEDLEKIRINTVLEDIVTLDDMEKAKNEFVSLKEKIIPEQSKGENSKYGRNGYVIALWNVIDSYEAQLENREKYLRQELFPKSYIIDTNIFVLFPKIMDYISRDDRIILSGKVLDELDKLKGTTSGNDKKNVREAIREINYMHKMKRDNVHFEFADIKLLPEDFDKNNADNMILSVALKFRERNPFVVSNDINFQNRAASLGIPYKSLEDIVPAEVYETIKIELAKRKSENEVEFKKSTRVESDYSTTDMPKDLLEIITTAYAKCQEKAADVKVSTLVIEIKKGTPSFDTNTYGYPKFKKLCEAYPSVLKLYEDNTSALCVKLVKRERSTSVYKSKRDSYENNRRIAIESESYRPKDTKAKDRLTPAKQIILNELVSKMISEEDPASPIQDGDIRNEFIRITKIPIKLNLVRQAREDQGIPSTKERKNNNSNKK